MTARRSCKSVWSAFRKNVSIVFVMGLLGVSRTTLPDRGHDLSDGHTASVQAVSFVED